MTNKIKKIRIKRGLSQSQLAEASGVSIRAIQSYEQGTRDISGASYAVVKALADALGVSTDEIV